LLHGRHDRRGRHEGARPGGRGAAGGRAGAPGRGRAGAGGRRDRGRSGLRPGRGRPEDVLRLARHARRAGLRGRGRDDRRPGRGRSGPLAARAADQARREPARGEWAGLMQAFAPGIYPRSEKLVQATRDLDRGRTTQEAVDEQVARDRDELVALQQQAGLDLLTDGLLTWQDHFRPILEASDGLEPGALTRFLDTNTFYRAPHATTATPRLSRPLDERYVAPVPGPRVATLPSPHALADGTGVEV